jgi:hypothetical protein
MGESMRTQRQRRGSLPLFPLHFSYHCTSTFEKEGAPNRGSQEKTHERCVREREREREIVRESAHLGLCRLGKVHVLHGLGHPEAVLAVAHSDVRV